jgi:hypothetical protein
MTEIELLKIEKLLITIGYKKSHDNHANIISYFLENKDEFININFYTNDHYINFIINPLSYSEKPFIKIGFINIYKFINHIKTYHKNYFRKLKLQKLKNYEK